MLSTHHQGNQTRIISGAPSPTDRTGGFLWIGGISYTVDILTINTPKMQENPRDTVPRLHHHFIQVLAFWVRPANVRILEWAAKGIWGSILLGSARIQGGVGVQLPKQLIYIYIYIYILCICMYIYIYIYDIYKQIIIYVYI